MSNTEKRNIELERLEDIAKQNYGGLPNLARAIGIDRTTFYSYKKYSGIGDKMLETLKNKLKINPDYIRYGTEPIFIDKNTTTSVYNNNDKSKKTNKESIIEKRNEVFERLENIAIKYFRSLSNMAQLAGKNRAVFFIYRNNASIGKEMLYTLQDKLNINPDYLLNGTEPIFIDNQPPDCVYKNNLPLISTEPIYIDEKNSNSVYNNNDKSKKTNKESIIEKRNEVFERLENIAIKYFRSLSNMAQLAGKNKAVFSHYKNNASIGRIMLYTLQGKLNINPEYLLNGTEPIFIDNQPPDCVYKKYDKKNPPATLSNVIAITPISSSVRAIPILDANQPTQTNDIINNPEILFDNNIRNERLKNLLQRRERVCADIDSLTILRDRLDSEIALLRRAELELSKK